MKKALMIVFTIACTLKITAQERQKNPEIYNAYTLAKAMSSLDDSLKSYKELKVLLEKKEEKQKDSYPKQSNEKESKNKNNLVVKIPEEEESKKKHDSLTKHLGEKQIYLFSILSQIMAYAEIEKFNYTEISKKLREYKSLNTAFEKIVGELNSSVKIIPLLDSLNKTQSNIRQTLLSTINPLNKNDTVVINKIDSLNSIWKNLKSEYETLQSKSSKNDLTEIKTLLQKKIIPVDTNFVFSIKRESLKLKLNDISIQIDPSILLKGFENDIQNNSYLIKDSSLIFPSNKSDTTYIIFSQLIMINYKLNYDIKKHDLSEKIEDVKTEIVKQYDKLSIEAKSKHSGFTIKSVQNYVNFEQLEKETQTSSSNTITYNLTSPEASSISFKMPSEAEMIDAMAIYLATRVKQEAVLWFFETMRNNTETFELIQTAFPETMSLLQSEETYSTPNLGPAWKYALSKDFVKMPQNILESEWLKTRIPVEHQNILGFLKISYDISRYVNQNFSYRDIISQLYMNKEKYNSGDTEIQAKDFLNILYAFSTEMNIKDTVMIKAAPHFRPISYEELRKLNSDEMLIMLSLMDLKYGKSFNKIFPFAENTFPYEKKEKAAIWMGQTLMTISQFENVLSEIKEMRDANKGKENTDNKFDYYSVWNLMSEVLNALTPQKDFVRLLGADSVKYTAHIKPITYSLKRLKDAFEIYDLLEQKNYAGAVSRTLALVDTLLYDEYVTVNLKALHYHDMPYESVKISLTNFKSTDNNGYSFEMLPKERNALIKELQLNHRQEHRVEKGNKIKLRKPLELSGADKQNPYYLGLRKKIVLGKGDTIQYEGLKIKNVSEEKLKFYIAKRQDGKYFVYDFDQTKKSALKTNQDKNIYYLIPQKTISLNLKKDTNTTLYGLNFKNKGETRLRFKIFQKEDGNYSIHDLRKPNKNKKRILEIGTTQIDFNSEKNFTVEKFHYKRIKKKGKKTFYPHYETYSLKSKNSKNIEIYYRVKRHRNVQEKMLIPSILKHPEQWQGVFDTIIKNDSIFKFPVESLAASIIVSNDKKALQVIRQVSNFLGDVSMAKDSKALSKVIESYAMPPGSYKKKRSVWYSWDLNAFVGVYGGYESKTNFKKESLSIDDSWVSGLSAPIGVSFSFNHGRRAYNYSNMNTGISKNPDGLKINKRKAYTLNRFTSTVTFSLVDIGAAVSFRFKDSDSLLSPKFKWEQFVSPGIHYSLSIPSSPLVVQAGFQITPQIRRVEKNGSGQNYQGMFRTYVGVFFDLPLYNIYSKTRKVKHEIGCTKTH